MCDENFTFVTYKRSRKIRNRPQPSIIPESNKINLEQSSCIDKDKLKKRIEAAKEEILASDFYSSVRASLREGQSLVENPTKNINEIVCFGLGRIGECMISRYQFALLLCLKDLYKCNVYAYDPVFQPIDFWILESYGCGTLNENLEGKYKLKKIQRNVEGTITIPTTLFYMPHCPSSLVNNLLGANWGLDLNRCVIINNSFHSIVDALRPSHQNTKDDHNYIVRIFPYITELAVINSFKFYEVFNNLAIHVFPWSKICQIPSDFWTNTNLYVHAKIQTM